MQLKEQLKMKLKTDWNDVSDGKKWRHKTGRKLSFPILNVGFLKNIMGRTPIRPIKNLKYISIKIWKQLLRNIKSKLVTEIYHFNCWMYRCRSPVLLMFYSLNLVTFYILTFFRKLKSYFNRNTQGLVCKQNVRYS
jgi:hypothetical protein